MFYDNAVFMSLMFIEKVAPGVELGAWSMDESVEELFSCNAVSVSLRKEFVAVRSAQRRLEVASVHALVYHIFGKDMQIRHDGDGKPCLCNGFNIGISHTKGCAAVIVSEDKEVAVDVEYMDERVERVVGRLLRDDEKAVTLFEKILHWCAKETLYKLYSADHLALSEMRLLSIYGDDGNGVITAENLRRNDVLRLKYKVVNGFVIVYAAL